MVRHLLIEVYLSNVSNRAAEYCVFGIWFLFFWVLYIELWPKNLLVLRCLDELSYCVAVLLAIQCVSLLAMLHTL